MDKTFSSRFHQAYISSRNQDEPRGPGKLLNAGAEGAECGVYLQAWQCGRSILVATALEEGILAFVGLKRRSSRDY